MTFTIRVPMLVVALVLITMPTFGQEAPPSLEFSFSNPGARSMALGGAFVALADDATAAFANPAGLVQLARPEVSLELRWRRYSTPYTAGGRAIGNATGLGIDTVNDLRIGVSRESATGLSFLSFGYPGTRWSLALYRHQLAEFVVRTELDGLFGDVPEGGVRRYEDQRVITELDIVGTGLSGAFQIIESLSIGVSLTYFNGKVENRGGIHLIDSYPDTFWDHNSFLPNRLFATSTFETGGSDWGFNLGFLWEFADSWRCGGVFRKGPRFSYELQNLAGPAHWLPEGSDLGSVTDKSIALPDVWGLGVAYRSPDGRLTVGFEWDRVEYSIIAKTLDSSQVDTSLVLIDDADEYHLGVEYVFLETTPLIAIRGGVWRDPDHRFRFIGDDPFSRALYPPGQDRVHLAVGTGIAFSRFQIDIGLDLSDQKDTVAVSAIYSF